MKKSLLVLTKWSVRQRWVKHRLPVDERQRKETSPPLHKMDALISFQMAFINVLLRVALRIHWELALGPTTTFAISCHSLVKLFLSSLAYILIETPTSSDHSIQRLPIRQSQHSHKNLNRITCLSCETQECPKKTITSIGLNRLITWIRILWRWKGSNEASKVFNSKTREELLS